MSIKRMPTRLLLLSLALFIWQGSWQGSRPVAASGHYGGGGGSSHVEAKCLRWVKIPADGGVDLGSPDAGDGGVAADMADAGAVPDHAGELCVERAGLFSCAVAGPGRGPGGSVGWGALAGLLILVAALRRTGSCHG